MATRIQVRRDTLANWTSNNPTLASGEIAFITDQNKIKIGDGLTSFNSLDYLEAEAFIDSVALGTDTTGNYIETLFAGDGISLSGEGVESASATITNTGVLSLTGTANEITVSASTGNVVLSLPTSITVDIIGNVTGNADTASALATARNISLGGDVSGSASFDGSADITITATVADDSHDHIIGNIDGLQTALDNNASSASAVASDLTDHENSTTSVHGIADTSELATKTYADNAASTAAANLVDSAPATLDTLNELAAALNDDPNFATTITNSIATKANDSDLTDHENATTNVHGIADTSLLATTSYVDTAESDAVSSANSYSDSLASNYDAAGSASAVASDLTDHENTTTSVHGISDTSLLATTSYVDTAESDAVTTANAYSDSLATNYDPAGSASTAQSNAESYADSLASNYDPAGSASAVASDLTDHENATTSVHGIADTSLLATTSYVDTAESDAVSTANSYADSLASNYDAAGSASAVASDLTDHENSTTSVHGIADTSALATKTYADNAASTAAANLVDSAPSTLDTLNELAAALGDDPNFATTVTNSIAGKQPLDADLTAIAALAGTSGFLKKTAANTWSLDTNTYLTGNQTITLTGDATGSGTTSISLTLANSGVSAATYGSASAVPTITIDAKGRITSASATDIAIAQSAVTNLTTDLAAKAPLASPALTGTPTAPTASAGTNTTQIATTEFVNTATAAVQPTIHPMFIIGGV